MLGLAGNPGQLASRVGFTGTWDKGSQIRDVPDNPRRVAALSVCRRGITEKVVDELL